MRDIVGGVGVLAAALCAVGTTGGLEAQEARRDWKQGIEYRIEARLDEDSQTLVGRSRIRYRNDSPDTLGAFYLHLYLNAFRPNSAWARRDLESGIRTFQELGPGEHGFERLTEATVDGRPVRLVYPYAPDSTIVGFDLPEPLAAGASLTVDLAWEARPSSVARRQGRRGRQYDFAQGYPRVVVYDDEGWRTHPLYRAGEFYGEFATYDVTLDLEPDQVVAATGVPVEGDPGWEAAAVPGTGPIDYQRGWYGSTTGPPCVERGGERICGIYPARTLRPAESLGFLEAAAPGRKQVRWYAEDVHHFAWSTSPDYIFEQGRWEDVAIRVLYRPGDEEAWGDGIAVRRTATALQWLDSIFGAYPYPQVTNLHRIEGGGTEFPMLVMDGSASQSLILHEVGHIYAHGILANNEWYEGWLDEGMSSFQTAWFFELAGAGPAQWEGARRTTLFSDLRGRSEPVVLRAEEYSSQGVYSTMIYRKGSVILWMLREMVGEETMVRILRTYYERYRFRHVDSNGFQAVAEEVTGRDLDWFFGPWLHATGLVDYALTDVEVRRDGEAWLTELRLERKGTVVMPVPIRLRGEGQEYRAVVDGSATRPLAQVRTQFRPDEVVLDPDGAILDWNPANNGWAPGLGDPVFEIGLDDPLEPQPVYLDRVPVGLFPLAWVNDAGGWVAGLQIRTSLLGMRTATLRVGLPALEGGGRGGGGRSADLGSLHWRLAGPLLGGRPREGVRAEAFVGEGRGFAGLSIAGGDRGVRLFGAAHWIYDESYLAPGRWTFGRRVGGEAGLGARTDVRAVGLDWVVDVSGAFGFDTDEHRWVRGAVRADGAAPIGDGWTLRAHLFSGSALGTDQESGDGSWSGSRVPLERQFFHSNADPWLTLGNPWLRSAGAALGGEGWAPGGGVLRGFAPALSASWIVTTALEVAGPALQVGGSGGIEIRPLGFVGAGTSGLPGLPEFAPPEGNEPGSAVGIEERAFLWSAGVGLELGRPRSPLRLRLDLPFAVSHPVGAGGARAERAGLRLQVGFLGG